MSVQVRPAREEDCALMPVFRREMEGGEFLEELRDEAYYRYKYLTVGHAFVAREGARLVGVTASTPRRVRMGAEVRIAAELGDLFVHPGQRGKGLFRELHDGVLAAAVEDGATLATVRAGRGAADHMTQAFGYRRLFGIAEMTGALTPGGRAGMPFGRVPVLNLLLPRVRFGRVEGIRGEVAPAGVVRDVERIAARYELDPSPYEVLPVGAAILVYRKKGFLVDVWGDEPGRAAVAAVRRLEALGSDVVWYWGTAESPDPVSRTLRRLGLRTVRRTKAVLVRNLGDGAVPPAEDWCFRMGDTDGI